MSDNEKCLYRHNCYRTNNKEHMENSHGICIYGVKCKRKNKDHIDTFHKHTCTSCNKEREIIEFASGGETKLCRDCRG